ncbi:uncharacterized protein LOC109847348 [Asparagus officinalis]|uniref:uncharacterized protein LOC109847348 n=1 Tax=Asparagus officinalis TaxID=4686 RepID=UPI00098E262E|nr:uncharacterized protein LOC109847348 [Asparagus officinalis]
MKLNSERSKYEQKCRKIIQEMSSLKFGFFSKLWSFESSSFSRIRTRSELLNPFKFFTDSFLSSSYLDSSKGENPNLGFRPIELFFPFQASRTWTSHVDDLDRLEREFRRLQELKTAGTSTYIAIRMESRLQAWRDTRASTGLEIQTQQSRVDQMEALAILGMAKDDLERSQVVISGKLDLSK